MDKQKVASPLKETWRLRELEIAQDYFLPALFFAAQ
jgi:hypothetical protein